jgi:hypothetical protein
VGSRDVLIGTGRGLILADYYRHDPRVLLVPAEHLASAGIEPAFGEFLRAEVGWSAGQLALVSAGFATYWSRSSDLAARTTTWVPPRRRNLGILIDPDPLAVRPYVQILNTSTWLLYPSDVDPARSNAEFLAYLLAHGDRMASTGEVTQAAVQNAAWWFDRSAAECDAFGAGARDSTRPDGEAYRALHAALPWLRQLRHDDLRPLTVVSPHRSIPTTGLLVPREHEAQPPRLVTTWTTAATNALKQYRAHWRSTAPAAVTALCTWLDTGAPPLLIMGQDERILWDPAQAAQVGAVRDVLRQADEAALAGIAGDLATIADHTQKFLGTLVDPTALPAPAANTEHSGLTFLHRTHRLVAYRLFEPGMERLQGPPLPYERAMVGARTVHEWAHLADTAGWIPRTVPPDDWKARRAALAVQLEALIERAPAAVQRQTAADRAELARERPVGEALVRILVSRLPDYRANLLSQHYLSEAERETYVRHNIRTLRGEYPRARLWRRLLRYVFEYQYLRFSHLPEPRAYFLHTTSFQHDFVDAGLCDLDTFEAVTAAVSALCDAYAVDHTRFHFPPLTT